MADIFKNKITKIENLLKDYYRKEIKGQLTNNEENYNVNFLVKNRIKKLLENVNSNNAISENIKQLQKNELLKLLAENTVSVDDCKISERIIEKLVDKKIITTNDVNYYRMNENTSRRN